MTLILAYHNPDFVVVCTDGRVSKREPDGTPFACPGVGKKFAVLRQDLILAGSSSWGARLDLSIFIRMRELVQAYPALTFGEIAAAIPAIVASAKTPFSIPVKTTISLILLGFDPAERRVRNVAFAFDDEECTCSEHCSGAVAAGFIEPQEGIGQKILEGMGDERTIESARAAMLTIAERLAEDHPRVIGAPFFFHAIERREERPA